MQKFLVLFLFSIAFLNGSENTMRNHEMVETPPYLYKVLSYELWQQSQNKQTLALPPEDDAFIHFSTDAQLERIITKFWANVPKYAVLKVNASKLKGEMTYETNPGGTAKYYHLYHGAIPLDAVVECTIVDSNK
jgi:uncharacterized protein (DUF952 family)